MNMEETDEYSETGHKGMVTEKESILDEMQLRS